MTRIRYTFDVVGMTCDSCARHVENAVRGLPSIESAKVPGWQSGMLEILALLPLDQDAIASAIRKAGYQAKITTSQSVQQDSKNSPMKSNDREGFDLMVIGGGSAGFAAAIKGAELGYQVGLIEAGMIGGTCVNVGCIPSKALIQAMRHHHQANLRPFEGIETFSGKPDWGKLIAQKDELVSQLRETKYVDVLAKYPAIRQIRGKAHLKGGTQVEVNGQVYHPGKIVIASGAQPWATPIPGLHEAGYLTSTTALELKELPDSLIILGANAVGLELAQVFSRGGTRVTVLELLPRIAPFEDELTSFTMHRYLEEEGVQVLTGFTTHRVEVRDGRYFVFGNQLQQDKSAGESEDIVLYAEQILVATGRRPNTKDLGLENAGIKSGKIGEIIVDATLRTSNPDIFAAGDVTGNEMFVYVAAYGGGLAAENSLQGSGRVLDTTYIPRVTFTDPQIASAGLTEIQASHQGFAVKTSVLEMASVPRAQVAHDFRGFVKLVADSSSDRLLGAHILAAEAGEMIQVASIAIRFGLTLSQLRDTMFPYLTYNEAIRLSAIGFDKDLSQLSCCAG